MTFQSPTIKPSSLNNIEAQIEGGICPTACINFGGTCDCASCSVFDPANVINTLFTKPYTISTNQESNGGPPYIEIYENAVFWAFIAASIWALLLDRSG